MSWDCEYDFVSDSPIILPCSFTAQVLAIDFSATNYRSTWYRSGYLEVFTTIGGSIFTGQKKTLGFGGQLIEIPYSSYQLKFQPVQWLEGASIKIQQLSLPEIRAIMPNYSPLPSTLGDQPVVDSIPTSFTAPAYSAAALPTAYQALAPNAQRQSFAFSNLGAAAVFLDFDPPSAANKRMITIAPNGTYIADSPYVGAVYLWSSNATTQAVEVRDLIQ
jgi:hypothetical protein